MAATPTLNVAVKLNGLDVVEVLTRAFVLLHKVDRADECVLDHDGNCQAHLGGNPCVLGDIRFFLAEFATLEVTAEITPECPHGDDPATCPPCRRAAGKDAPLAKDPPEVGIDLTPGREFTARYAGHCHSCDLPIYVGQLCVRPGDGRTVHAGCAS